MLEKISKVIITGPVERRTDVLEALQRLGLVQVETYTGDTFSTDGREVDTSAAEQSKNVLKSLEKLKRQAVSYDGDIPDCEEDAQTIIETLPDMIREHSRLRDRETTLRNKLDSLRPWGTFDLELLRDIEERGKVSIQFWDVALKDREDVDTDKAIAAVEISRDTNAAIS